MIILVLLHCIYIWNSNNESLRRIVWRCNKKYIVKGEVGCDNRHIEDKVLYQVFINIFNTVVENKEYFLEKWKEYLKSDNLLQRYKAKQFIRIIENAESIKEFDMDLFFKIIEKFTVIDSERIIVTLLDGTEIECKIE